MARSTCGTVARSAPLRLAPSTPVCDELNSPPPRMCAFSDLSYRIAWHPSNPDVLVVAPGYNNNERTIKAVSLSKGTELATFRYKGNKCCAVGIYGNVVAAATGDVELFTFTDGENVRSEFILLA